MMECRVEAPWRQSYILGDHIGEQIIAKVKNAGWFSVIADEVTDSSNKQHLSLVVRYVDSEEGFARSDLVDLIDCDTGISGQSITNKIVISLKTYMLNRNMLRGQGYDGAGNVRCYQGCCNSHQSAVSTGLLPHRSSHCLNSAVVNLKRPVYLHRYDGDHW